MSDNGSSKYCPDCRRALPASAFTRDSRRKDGLSFYCRDCRVLRDEASRHRRRGRPKIKVKPRDLVVPDGHKWCPDCEIVKPLAEFPANRSTRSGYMSYCKPCFNQRTRESYDRNGGSRNYHLRRRYGIALEHFERMFAEQGGLCAICHEAPAAHVDHDHATGRVRGLLCFNCNGALGQFRDRADLMLLAVAYLRGDPYAALLKQPGVQIGLHVFTGMPPAPPAPEDLDAAPAA